MGYWGGREGTGYWGGREGTGYWGGRERTGYWGGREGTGYWGGREKTGYWGGREGTGYWGGRVTGEGERGRVTGEGERGRVTGEGERGRVTGEGERGRVTGEGERGRVTGEGERRRVTGEGERERVTGEGERRRVTGEGERGRVTGEGERRRVTGEGERGRFTGKGERRRVTGEGERGRVTGEGERRRLLGTVVQKCKNLSEQEKGLSTSYASVQSTIDLTEQCVAHSSDDEILHMHTEIQSRIREIEEQQKEGKDLEPVEEVDLGVEVNCAEDLKQLCQTKAKITQLHIDAAAAVIGECLKSTEVNKPSQFEVIPLLSNGRPPKQACVVACSLKSLADDTITQCQVELIEGNKYRICWAHFINRIHL